MSNILLTPDSQLAPRVNRVLTRVFAQLDPLLPQVEVHHIGGTAIPGALTKGDMDLVVRVSHEEFPKAVTQLKTAFAVKQPQNWLKDFASFGDDTGYELPLGVQLVVRDSENDVFIFLRDYLIANPETLARYNQLKLKHAPEGTEGYWKAKHFFFAEILAKR